MAAHIGRNRFRECRFRTKSGQLQRQKTGRVSPFGRYLSLWPLAPFLAVISPLLAVLSLFDRHLSLFDRYLSFWSLAPFLAVISLFDRHLFLFDRYLPFGRYLSLLSRYLPFLAFLLFGECIWVDYNANQEIK